MRATVGDIVREDVAEPKLVIGIFMSPFDVHYNRAPLDASIRFIRRHPARGGNAHMGPMHWRILRKREPYYEDSVHIVQNERTVTLFAGEYRGAAAARVRRADRRADGQRHRQLLPRKASASSAARPSA